MKNLILAMLIMILLVNGVLHGIHKWIDFSMLLQSFNLDIMSASILFSALTIVAVLIGFVVAMSVLGTALFVGCAILSTLFIESFTAFWPALMIMFLAIYLLSDKIKHDVGDTVFEINN